MKQTLITQAGTSKSRGIKAATALSALMLLAACQTTGTSGPYSGVDYRTDKAEAALAETNYRTCENEAIAMDAAARESGDTAQYLTSAKLFDRCLGELSDNGLVIPAERQMKAHALSVINYFKGGDVAKARLQLANMRARYRGSDLYFNDRTSVIDTLSLLLGDAPESAAASHSLLNASKEVKAEMRRKNYWVEK